MRSGQPLKPVSEKAPSVETTVWVCSECRNPRKTREDADACCVCKCKRNVRLQSHGTRQSECEQCTIKSAIRYTQESIKRNKASLKSSEEYLAELRQRKAVMAKTDVWVEGSSDASASESETP